MRGFVVVVAAFAVIGGLPVRKFRGIGARGGIGLRRAACAHARVVSALSVLNPVDSICKCDPPCLSVVACTHAHIDAYVKPIVRACVVCPLELV